MVIMIKKSVSAGGVVLNKNLVLVVSQHGSSWSLPKGHIEKDESPLDTAKREIFEESGVKDLVFVKELSVYQRSGIAKDCSEDKNKLKTIHMFLFKSSQKVLKPVDPENPEARWVKKDKVADLLTHPKDKEFFLSVLKTI